MGFTTFGRPSAAAGGASSRSRSGGGRVFAALPAELEDRCSSSVFMRARAIAARGETMLFDLDCGTDPDGGLMTLHGRVHGSTSPHSVYRTWVSFDARTEEYDDGACTCPAYTGYRFDVCKHMAALALYFADHPGRFRGFDGAGAGGSSMDLLDCMQRLDETETQRRQIRYDAMQGGRAPGGGDGARGGTLAGRTASFGSPAPSRRAGAPLAMVGPGQVSLDPLLAYADGSWSVSFRIRNLANGASYVLKSVSRFSLDMRYGEYEQYGQKLAFTHTPDMLDDYGRAVLRFMRRAIATRETALKDARYHSPVLVERDMRLTDDELSQLLHASEGRRIGLDFDRWLRSTPDQVPVERGERPIRITMHRAKQGSVSGYALYGDVHVEALVEGAERTYLLVGPAPKPNGGGPGEDAAARGDGGSAADDPASAARALTSMGARGIANLPDEDLVRLGLLPEPVASGASGASGASADGSAQGDDAPAAPLHTARDRRWFCRFPASCEPIRPVIATLCDGDPDGRFIADGDLPLFARTLLPLLQRSGLDGDIPDDVRGMQPQPCEPEFYLDASEDGVTCALKARYGTRVAGLIPLVPADRGGSHDFALERVAERTVRRYFDVDDARRPASIDHDDTHALVTLFDEGLAALRDVGKVFTTPAFDRLLAPRPPRMRLSAAMDGGLVEVSVLADEVPPDEVGAVLASYRRRQRFHRLRDGTFVPLGGHDADIDAIGDAARDLGLDADAFEKGDGSVRVPGFQAFLVDGEVDDADKDATFTRYVNELRIIDPSRYEVPGTLAGVLRPYQAEGYRWLQTLWDKGFGGILADEMGLGKSVQFIAMLLARKAAGQIGATASDAASPGASAGPALIVCPASLVYNWAAEFARFAPSLDVRTVAGTKAERRALLASLGGTGEAPDAKSDARTIPDVLVTSYDLLRLDVDDYRGHAFAAMALDEAQVIKNHATKVARAVKSVDARHRFALTGTPVENRLAELWSIFDFLMPGLLGGFRRFHERYELPVSSDAYGDEGRAQAAKLKALVGVFILRRLKSQVLTDLPDKLENVVTVQLEGEQRRLYAAHEQRLKVTLTHTDVRDFNAERIRILAELTRLRQICCDPRLLYSNAKDRSAKLAAIEELVTTCIDEGKKALVFSQFTSFLELIGERLRSRDIAYYTITGETPKKRRVELVDRFNGDDVPVFLISLKAGNTGLNLVGASVVIHADPWWNAAAQDQATDRAHRIGQTRDVNVYQIVAKDTVEERMLRLQRTKSEIARQVVGAAGVDGADGAGADGGAAGAAGASGAGVTTGIASLTKGELLGLLSA